MNEFCAKKLGEVLAFASVSLDTAGRGEQALKETWGEDGLADFINQNKAHIETINQIAAEDKVVEIVNKKLSGTGEKLKKMRDLYVGDEWDNPTELLEWSGFFEGAAIVHWQLVSGAGESLNNEKIKKLATEALIFHKKLFNSVEEKLTQVGKDKARQ